MRAARAAIRFIVDEFHAVIGQEIGTLELLLGLQRFSKTILSLQGPAGDGLRKRQRELLADILILPAETCGEVQVLAVLVEGVF